MNRSLAKISGAVALALLAGAALAQSPQPDSSYTDLSTYLLNRDQATAKPDAGEGTAGGWNTSMIDQTGDYNTATVAIQGFSNVTTQSQIGSDNASALVVTGDLNAVSLTQEGNGNSASLTVVGQGNTISQSQVGNNLSYSLTEIGAGKTISIQQTGLK